MLNDKCLKIIRDVTKCNYKCRSRNFVHILLFMAYKFSECELLHVPDFISLLRKNRRHTIVNEMSIFFKQI